MAQRRYCKNKTAGQHPGQKWDAQTKAGVLTDYMYDPKLCGNICAVAAKWGVPESTIRTWLQKELTRKDGKKGTFAKEYAAATREIIYRAADGARSAVTQMQRRAASGELEDSEAARYAVVLTNIAAKMPGLLAQSEEKAAQLGEKEAQAGGVTLLAAVMDAPEGEEDGRNDTAGGVEATAETI